MKRFSRLICNLLPAGCRMDTLEGRDYTVVPMVILTEGVHSGSKGPLYYPKDELAKTPVAWNHKPIVVYHPSMNGESVSACDPVILNNRKIGLMLNTKFEGSRLKSEAWIEKDRANKVDDRIMAAVDAKEVMELSTGVFIDVEEEAGKWGEEEYVGIARNYRPDHLALLPDQIGACSVKDGAGLLRNQALADDEMSHSNIYNAITTALRKKFNVTNDGPYLWVNDVFSDFAVYEKDGKMWHVGYTANDSGVTLNDEKPTEVVRVTEYRMAGGAFVGNNQTKNQTTMNKKLQMIAALIAANVGLADTDSPLLEEMSDDQIDTLHSLHEQMPTVNFKVQKKDGKVGFVASNTPSVPSPAPFASVPAPAEAPVAPAKPVTPAPLANVQDYISQAPPEMREVLNNSLSIYNEEKNKLVDLILGNKQNQFTKEDLTNRPLNELRNIARLAAPAEGGGESLVPRFYGQAPVPTSNLQGEEAMEVPVMTFSRSN